MTGIINDTHTPIKTNENKPIKTDENHLCPIHAWVIHNHAACNKNMVGGIANCEICGKPICPDCSNHQATQLSRVTGYIQDVSGWNAGKRQELADRQKHDSF